MPERDYQDPGIEKDPTLVEIGDDPLAAYFDRERAEDRRKRQAAHVWWWTRLANHLGLSLPEAWRNSPPQTPDADK